MAIGLAQPGISPAENRSQKDSTCQACREFMRAFEARNGSTICRELLECDISTPEGLAHAREKNLFQSRCSKYIREAVEIVDSMLTAGPSDS